MNWKEIKEKYPKAWIKMFEYFKCEDRNLSLNLKLNGNTVIRKPPITVNNRRIKVAKGTWIVLKSDDNVDLEVQKFKTNYNSTVIGKQIERYGK